MTAISCRYAAFDDIDDILAFWLTSSTASPCGPTAGAEAVGSALLAAGEERFRAAGARRADAMVLVDNTLGEAAWAAAGYLRQEDWRRWVKPL